jgi:TrmH family RNA methyltransferase
MAELSQNKLKYLTSLHQKKQREAEGVFIAEGIKVMNDLVKFGCIPQLIAYNPAVWNLKDLGQSHAFCEYYTLSPAQANKISLLSTPPGIIAVFPKPRYELEVPSLNESFVFLLDNINDPGNLGTIIRTAHWFGISNIYVTTGSVEIFAPKVVQSSMGSLAAVKVHLVDSELFISTLRTQEIPIYLAETGGEDIQHTQITQPACFVFGNESNGISNTWKQAATRQFTIHPASEANRPESLNLSVSAAIFMELLTR